jgi:ribonuclease HI
LRHSSKAVRKATKRWPDRWQRNGWRTAKGEPVANRALWEGLIEQAARHRVTWRKVAGHAGNPLNERVDRLAGRAAREQSAGSS